MTAKRKKPEPGADEAAVLVPLQDLKPWDKNPRINEAAVPGVAASIKRFGFASPIIARKENGEVIAGHTRLKAAQSLGIDRVPVRYMDLSEAEAHLLAVADNKLSEKAEWDNGALSEVLASFSLDDAELAGFDSAELEKLGAELLGDDKEAPSDDVPEPPADPVTKLGDVWILGDHRLVCGDSTDRATVARLMGGERAAIMNTDPPYGVSYDNADRPNPGVAKPRVANDELTDGKLQEFLEKCFTTAVDVALSKNAAWYMWHAHLTQGYFAAAAAAAAADVVLHRQIIWVKPVLLLGRGQYHWKHEPCFMGWVKGHQPPDYGAGAGERNQTTIWEVGSVSQAERKEFNHATPKPVRLFEIPIIKHTKRGDVCYEPFAGSGPQFMAAEVTGRRCFGIELNPAHCDVIVKRWEDYTGKKATLEAKRAV